VECEVSRDWGHESLVQKFRGEIAARTQDWLHGKIFQGRGVVIVKGSGESGLRSHMLVSLPPKLASAKLVQYMKGPSSRMLQEEFPHLKKQ
jgi:putative transposase